MTRYIVLAIDDTLGYGPGVDQAIEDLVDSGPDGMIVATPVTLDARHARPVGDVSQDEWEAHWAFYRLAVDQRDRAWAEVEAIKASMPAGA